MEVAAERGSWCFFFNSVLIAATYASTSPVFCRSSFRGNAVVVILAGFLIDKLGNCLAVFVFSLLTVLGSSVFALGAHFKGSSYLLPMMLTGRLFFGSGVGSLTMSSTSSPSSLRQNLEYSGHSGEDYVGLRGVFAVSCAALTPSIFALLAFTFVPPLVSTVWLGITYSFAALASMWPSIPLVVPQATLGMAMGLATSTQMVEVGLSNLIMGCILGTQSSELKTPLWHWQQVMIFMLANTVACTAASISLNLVDKRQGGTLNRRRKGTRVEQDKGPADAAPLFGDGTGDEGSVS